ncbi:hypothetical protein Dimus_011144, partial [Dionaea muscipula]
EKGQDPMEMEREKGEEKEASSLSVVLLMGNHGGGNGNLKEAVNETKDAHGVEKELSGREQVEAGEQLGAEDVDPSIMKEGMKVFERDENLLVSQAPPKQQQKLSMATGEEKRLKRSVAVTQAGHSEGSAAMSAQVVKGIGKEKSGAKEAERKWPCPNVEPTESILHTDEQIEENVTLVTAQENMQLATIWSEGMRRRGE